MKELKDIVLKKGDIITAENKDGQWSVDIVIDEPKKLVDKFLSKYNIISIKRPVKYETIYEASKEILDKEEKEWLENFLRPFRNKIRWIAKCYAYNNNEYITISVKDESCLELPNFKVGTMYKGMTLCKVYTLKELGLFKGEEV